MATYYQDIADPYPDIAGILVYMRDCFLYRVI
jgi:hypothetical protein